MERAIGVEPTTSCLASKCSTTELYPRLLYLSKWWGYCNFRHSGLTVALTPHKWWGVLESNQLKVFAVTTLKLAHPVGFEPTSSIPVTLLPVRSRGGYGCINGGLGRARTDILRFCRPCCYHIPAH